METNGLSFFFFQEKDEQIIVKQLKQTNFNNYLSHK